MTENCCSRTGHGTGAVGVVRNLSVGGIGELWRGEERIESAFIKSAVTGPIKLTELGFVGDEHVYHGHGGPDKSVCVYSYEHYSHWRETTGADLPDSCAFGENFTTEGLVETDCYIGDVYEVGSALVQITQPRSPCYKIAARYGIPKLAFLLKKQGRTGFMMRTLRPGLAQAGDQMVLVHRQDHPYTVHEANRILQIDVRNRDSAANFLDTVPDLGIHSVTTLRERVENSQT